MITAPTPPTPPTPPARLESTSPRMIQIEPPSSPVPKVFSRIHEIREAQKQSQTEEYSDEDYSEAEEYTESDDEYSEEEYIEEVPEVEPVTIPETTSEPVARDRVQVHHRSEDGNFESTSSTEREPIQTNNRMPGQVQPYEVTEQVADARGKLIVEQFRKIEEAREKQQSNQSNQTQQTQTRVDIPRVNPSDYKSSTGTIIFTITAILVLVVVAFFTLRKSVLQKAKEKMSAESDNSTVENIPTEKNPVVNLSIKRAPIKKVETAFESKIESKPAESVEKKSVLQIKKNPIKKIDPVPIKTEPIQSEIPVDEVKSVDRDPDDKKIKGLNFEIRV